MTKPFDPTKPVQTRDGRPARIICTDKRDDRTIVALVEKNGMEDDYHYFPDGRSFMDMTTGNDLINIPQKFTKYGLLHKGDNRLHGHVYAAESEAAEGAGAMYRVVTITWEE